VFAADDLSFGVEGAFDAMGLDEDGDVGSERDGFAASDAHAVVGHIAEFEGADFSDRAAVGAHLPQGGCLSRKWSAVRLSSFKR